MAHRIRPQIVRRRSILAALGIAATVAISACSSRPAAPPRSEFAAAEAQWLGEAAVISSANQDTALTVALDDLQSNPTSRERYAAGIAALKGFGRNAVPGATPAQQAEAQADFGKVNAFFGLPTDPFKNDCIASGPGATAATKAWATEPPDTYSGVNVDALIGAAADLKHGLISDSGDKSCYAAAIADLEDLASATRREIAATANLSASSSSVEVRYGNEVNYLTAFFDLVSPSNNRSVLSPPQP